MPTEQSPRHDVRIATHLREAFLNERPGWPAHYARHVARRALKVMGVSETLAFEAETVISELTTNAVKYGHALNEFDIVHFPASEEAGPETVYLVTTNPAPNDTATPGVAHRGELAAAESNDQAEHGRGLLMTDAYTNSNWGQRNVVSPDGVHEIITFAVLASSEDAATSREFPHGRAA